MKHLLNNLSEEEKQSILEQHNGGMRVFSENFKRLIGHKSGTILNEQPQTGSTVPQTGSTVPQTGSTVPQTSKIDINRRNIEKYQKKFLSEIQKIQFNEESLVDLGMSLFGGIVNRESSYDELMKNYIPSGVLQVQAVNVSLSDYEVMRGYILGVDFVDSNGSTRNDNLTERPFIRISLSLRKKFTKEEISYFRVIYPIQDYSKAIDIIKKVFAIVSKEYEPNNIPNLQTLQQAIVNTGMKQVR